MPPPRGKIHPVVAVTIAASDSSGGAGIQADLATFAAHGVYGASVVTAVTAQSTRGIVRGGVSTVAPGLVSLQMDAVFPDLRPRAVKIGALGSAAVVRAVARGLERHRRQLRNVVLDPVLASKDGALLLAESARGVLLRDLFPLCDLVTPNLPEAEALSGIAIRDESDRRRAASILADAGAGAVLIKGGHFEGGHFKGGHFKGARGATVVDLLFDGRRFIPFRHPRIGSRALHGTGCVLSSAIAANLALGAGLAESVERATVYIEGAIRRGVFPGRGRGVPGRFRSPAVALLTPRRKTGTRAGRRPRRTSR